MERDYWQRQEVGKPLFPELEWSRPENRTQAGKLLIIGGNLHGFAAPAEAYAAATRAGIGTARVLLPDKVRKIIGPMLENGEFAPSTPSGSFGQQALDEFIARSNWADAALIAGDLGRNSETAILLEKFLEKCSLPVTLTKDAVDYVTTAPHIALNRPNTLLVLSLSQLQRVGTAAKSTQPISFGMDLLHLVDWLHEFTLTHRPYLIVKHLDTLLVAANGQVTTTKLHKDQPIWRVNIATNASVWWLQHFSKPLQALSTAIVAM